MNREIETWHTEEEILSNTAVTKPWQLECDRIETEITVGVFP